MRYWTIATFIIFTACGQKNKNSEARRLEHARALVKKVGLQELPFSYDIVKGNIDSRHSVDRDTNDTLFFDESNEIVGGVLPDTSNYFGFIYYKVGDSLYPFLMTVDKKGNIIDRQPIGVGACGGFAIDVDSCVARVSIDKNLEIDALYKMRGSAETNDSIPKTVEVCERIFGKGAITKEGKIQITKREQWCE